MENNHEETKQERREEKRRKKKEQVQKHGKNLATIYKEAILKRLRGGR
ncbi:hypothetical protein ACFLVC_02950 [Chloroflexota bacterium]